MRKFVAGFCLLTLLLPFSLALAEEPLLPSGLGESRPVRSSDGPSLPAGIDGADSQQSPDIWTESDNDSWGQSDDLWGDLHEEEATGLVAPFGLTGFTELRSGRRLSNVDHQRQTSLAEFRLELEKDWQWQDGVAKITADLLYDDVEESQGLDLETGAGWLDVREMWLQQRLSSSIDIKAGRQILTWGVGDLIFINDLFPKDWNSFLAGRDEQYLKAPSDAFRVGFFSDQVNINLIYTPRFDADRFIDGRRLSYFSPLYGQVVGSNGLLTVDQPDSSWQEDEWAVRLYRSLASFEVALYGYDGYWKSPGGFNPLTGDALFPRLQVLGASARGPLGPGIFTVEAGYYRSLKDRSGGDPFINNDEFRLLSGYEWEAARDTTLGLQYYVEAMQDYSAYKASTPVSMETKDHYRQLVTLRLTRLAMSQNLTLSLFVFYSPTDKDSYVRPKVQYKMTDAWLIEGGFNLFAGKNESSFFGQFEDNTNAYASIRYNF